MKVTGCIPSRYASTRLPGKPLRDIGGKPMVIRVVEQATQAKSLDHVVVLCDDTNDHRLDAVSKNSKLITMNAGTSTNRTHCRT